MSTLEEDVSHIWESGSLAIYHVLQAAARCALIGWNLRVSFWDCVFRNISHSPNPHSIKVHA